MQDLEAIKLFQTEQKLKDAELKIIKIEEECRLAKATKDFNAQMHEKALAQKADEVNLFTNKLKTINKELKDAVTENGRKQKQNLSLRSRNIALDERNKLLEENFLS